MLRYEWIWYKDRGTGFLNARRMPLKKSKNILVFYKKLPKYNPQFEYREPYLKTHTSSGLSSNYGKFTRSGTESRDGRRFPGNVIQFTTVTGGIHPTQKPVELCDATALTQRMVAELINHIDVYHVEKVSGQTTQKITIHYNCIGAFEVPDRESIGVHVMLTTLAINGIELEYTQKDLYETVLQVASSEVSYEELLHWVLDHET